MLNNLTKNTLLVILTSLVFLGMSSFTFARAGDGDSFGGGGYDSGGSSSFSDSDWGSSSTGTYYSSSSEKDGDGVAAVIVIIIVIIIIIASRKGKGGIPVSNSSTESGVINPTNKSMSEEELKENLKKLKELDAKFDIQKFKTHTKKVFISVQEGWTQRDQKECRPFMSEEVYQSHQMQIDNMKKDKVINVLKNIVVGSTEVVRIDLGDEYHKLAMRMRASMKDYKVKEDNIDKIIDGNDQQTPPFTEYWIFIRRSNLKTKIKDGLFDRKCPNCGAPIDIDVAGVCKYCDANVVNGDYDWVLSEIIQKSEWSE